MWYLTVGQRGTRCQSCDDYIPTGDPMYYFHDMENKVVLCEECGVIEGIAAKPSKRLQRYMSDKRRAQIRKKQEEREPALF